MDEKVVGQTVGNVDRPTSGQADRQSADFEWSLLGGHPLKSLLKTWIFVTWKLRSLISSISPNEWSHLYRFYGFKLLSVSAKDLLKFASLSVFSSAENPWIAQSSSHQKTKECTHLVIYLRGKAREDKAGVTELTGTISPNFWCVNEKI